MTGQRCQRRPLHPLQFQARPPQHSTLCLSNISPSHPLHQQHICLQLSLPTLLTLHLLSFHNGRPMPAIHSISSHRPSTTSSCAFTVDKCCVRLSSCHASISFVAHATPHLPPQHLSNAQSAMPPSHSRHTSTSRCSHSYTNWSSHVRTSSTAAHTRQRSAKTSGVYSNTSSSAATLQ